jgi:hypothetical protein
MFYRFIFKYFVICDTPVLGDDFIFEKSKFVYLYCFMSVVIALPKITKCADIKRKKTVTYRTVIGGGLCRHSSLSSAPAPSISGFGFIYSLDAQATGEAMPSAL